MNPTPASRGASRRSLLALAFASAFALTAPDGRAADPFDSNQTPPASAPNAKGPAPRDRRAAPFTSAADIYSGYSGPGQAVVGHGLGGWRSGREGLRYKGPYPKPGWQLDWDAKRSSSDQVIELGLLPPIRPLLELHLRDTIIQKGHDGYYYLTGSTGDNIWDRNDGIELWRSKDLQNWDYRGVIWDIEREGTWQKQCRYLWAPEIHYIKGNYYIPYCMSGGPNGGTGILKSTTGRAEGPYVNATATDGRLTGGIDATLFVDDDGAVYFTWGRGSKIYRMKDDLSGFADEGRDVAIEPESLARAREIGKQQGAAFEGASLFKRNGKYYLGGAVFIGGIDRATGRNGRYSSAVMIADNIHGPYRQWHEAVACGGGGNYFKADDGHWYCTYFGNDEASPFREKPALVRIDFAADDTIVIAEEQPAFVLREGTPTRWRKNATAAVALAPSSAATPAAVAPAAPPKGGAIVPPPAPRAKGLGISGPGAVKTPRWKTMNERLTGEAVKAGLIPDLKPLIPDMQIRDTVVIVGADGQYYLTGSTGNDIWDHNDGVELWRSADLKTWDYVGLAWTFEKDGTWHKDWRHHHKPVRALWAPELHYIKRLKNYFITLSMPPGGRGVLKSTTGKPEGPYVNALANDERLGGDIDASLFEDDDGQVYLVWGGGWIARMKDDLSGLAEEPRKPVLLNPDKNPAHHAATCPPRRDCSDIGHEGAYLFKHDGRYYLTAADMYQGRYSSMVAISDNVYGPYDRRHEAVPCGGGTNYFKDKEGRWWCAYFGNDDQSSFREKPALVRVEFAPDGKIRVAKDQPDFVLAAKP
jgi:xylan 1,4-beta-xylosidase